MLNILVVGSGWPHSGTFIERRLRALVLAGIQVIVVAKGKPSAPLLSPIPGIQIVWLYSDSSITSWLATGKALLFFLLHQPVGFCRLWRILKNHAPDLKSRLALARRAIPLAHLRPDIIHFEWNSTAINYEWMFDWYHCAIVVSCRGRQINIWPHLPNKIEFTDRLKRTFEKATVAHCVSQSLAREAIKLGLRPEKTRVIYTAVDPDFHSPAEKRGVLESPIHLITVGALIWRKGFEYALMALRILLEQGFNVRLEIIGDGIERDRIVYTAQDLGIKDQVQLSGRLSPVEVRDRLRSADIFILPSLSEGIANVAVEAMACGLPIVTTECGGMCEAVENGAEGFVVPSRDPAALAEALIQLIQNPGLRSDMGRAGRQRVLRQFTLDRQAEQFITLYQGLLSSVP
jgi:colanic acid/amylovoran biosynthesis glycosyltransferase